MLTLDEFLGIAVGRGGIIPRRDLKLHRHLRSVLHLLAISRHESRKCLEKIAVSQSTAKPIAVMLIALVRMYRIVGMWQSSFLPDR